MPQRFNIVAQKYAGFEDPYLPGMPADQPALLAREPDNPADAFAVAVYVDGRRVGYLSKRENVAVAKHIDAHGKSWRDACIEAGLALDTQALPVEHKTLRATFRRSASRGYPQVEVDF